MNLDIKEIAGTGISTAGLIIATSIFLQMITTKFMSIFERYRTLTEEYRNGSNQARKDSLEEQISLYYHRTQILRKVTRWLLWGECVFVITILSTTLSVVFARADWLKYLAGASLAAGLLILCVGAAFDMKENGLAHEAIDSEIKDFPNLPREQPASSAPENKQMSRASR